MRKRSTLAEVIIGNCVVAALVAAMSVSLLVFSGCSSGGPTASASEAVSGASAEQVSQSDNATDFASLLGNAKAGDVVEYGVYEQDNDLSNGPEPILWRVLTVEGDKALVVSEYVLDAYAFNDDGAKGNNWEASDLRAWLISDFAQSAGLSSSAEELTLLSVDEAKRYFSNRESLVCHVTAYAESRGIQTLLNGASDWWLRTSGDVGSRASTVDVDGNVLPHGQFVFYYIGVRPAIWLPLDDGVPELSNYHLDYNAGKMLDLNWGWALFDRDATAVKRSSYDEDLAKAAAYLCEGTYHSKEDAEWRMKSLGFSNPHSEYYDAALEANTSPITVASDVVAIDGESYLVVAVAVRGTQLSDIGDVVTDVRSGVFNVDGFAEAGEADMSVVRDYCIARQGESRIDAGHTILFVTGHSLGAAVAGQIAGNLEGEVAQRNRIFAYTFASPYYETHGKETGAFTNIHNLINTEDAVPKYPIGGQRYGIDHRFKGDGVDLLDQHMLGTYLDGVLGGVSNVDASGGVYGR